MHATWTPAHIEAIVYLNGSRAGAFGSGVDAARALATARRIQAWFDASHSLLGDTDPAAVGGGGGRRPSVPIVQHLLTTECADAPAAMRRIRAHANGTRAGAATGLFVDVS